MTYSPDPTTLDQALREIRALRQQVQKLKIIIEKAKKELTEMSKTQREPVAIVAAEYEWEDYTSYKTNRLHIVPLKAIHESGLKEGDKLYTMPHTSITEGAT